MKDGRYKILIVDDDQFILKMYRNKLEKLGHEVLALSSGQTALVKLKEGYRPDLVILDIVMPAPDGLETLAQIRKEKLAPDAATVILSNQGASEEINRAKSLGIDGYIVKAALIPSEVSMEVLKIAEEKKRHQ